MLTFAAGFVVTGKEEGVGLFMHPSVTSDMVSMSFKYSVSGLMLTSPVELPSMAGLAAVAANLKDKPPVADVSVRFRDLDTKLQGDVLRLYDVELRRNEYLLTIPQVARFLIRDGSTLHIHVADGTPDQIVGHILVERVLPLLWLQRGSFCLNGRFFSHGGKTALLLGKSETGLDLLVHGLRSSGCEVSDIPFMVVGENTAKVDHIFLCHPQFPLTSQPEMADVSSFKALVDVRGFVSDSEAIRILGLETPLMEGLGRTLLTSKVHDLCYSMRTDIIPDAIRKLLVRMS